MTAGAVVLAERPPVPSADRPVLVARLLGRFSVCIDGGQVDTQSSRRTRNVLAYLLSHRHSPVPRDVLMDTFWPDVNPRAARNSLHVALSGVRQALRDCWDAPVLSRTFDTYAISSGIRVWVDVEEFEKRCRAARRAERIGDLEVATAEYEASSQLYDGDFLADDPYSEWAAPIRDALKLSATDVQTRLVQLYAARGDHGAAVHLARWILATDPCNETVQRELISCYARTGQTNLALVQYQRCADALWEAYRVAPAAQTRALHHRLLETARRFDRPA
jgi:SARP family transcriptional regulator, regulator of embCAB operon